MAYYTKIIAGDKLWPQNRYCMTWFIWALGARVIWAMGSVYLFFFCLQFFRSFMDIGEGCRLTTDIY